MVKRGDSSWTFLSNHSHVLLCLVRDPSMRMRDIAEKVGMTERAVQRIISDLDEAGYLQKGRDGRCNTYKINLDMRLRHPLEANKRIADLVKLVFGSLDPTDTHREFDTYQF